MFQRTFHDYKIAEAKGHIPRGTAFRLTLATCLEAAAASFHKAYFGQGEWAKESDSIRRDEKAGEELVGTLQESFLSDLSSTRGVIRTALKESHATTDFPIVLANLRQRVIRDGYTQGESMLVGLATPRPTSNFRLIEGVSISNFEDLEEQPEAEDVTYGTFGYSEDGYRVALRSKAIKFTYQLWKNDDLGLIMAGMKKGGIAARRARSLVVIEAILAGLPAVEVGGVGGPTIERLEAAIVRQGEIAVGGLPQPRLVTDLLLPVAWQTTAQSTLNSQQVNRTGDKMPTANPVLGAATSNVDLIWSEKAGRDWLVFDRNSDFVELSVLDDFAAGPLTITKLPDVGEHPEMGAFSDNTIHVKFADCCGAKVTPEGARNALRVKGA